MFLTISIRTIKLRRIKGVPFGTVWAIMFLVLFHHPKIIMLNHSIRALVNEKFKWAVGVKTKGVKAIKFIALMFKNNIIRIM